MRLIGTDRDPHRPAEVSCFDAKRPIDELNAVVSSRARQTYLAEAYTGRPNA